MKRLPPLLRASVESFLYRGPTPLYQQLSAIAADCLNGDHLAYKRFEPVLRDLTKINVTVQIQPLYGYNAYMAFPQVDVNHVFRTLSPGMKEGAVINYGAYAKFLRDAEGGVTTRGTVTGVFAEIPCTMLVAQELFDGTYTPQEIAAVMLHETGHAFSYFATVGRTVVGSILIHETLDHLRRTDDLNRRAALVEDSVRVLRLSNVDVTALAEKDQEQAYEAVMIRNVVAQLMTDYSGGEKVFNGEVEYVADSYATRSGAAKPLASALMKNARQHHHVQTRTDVAYYLAEGAKVAASLIAVLYPPLLPVVVVISGLYIASESDTRINRNNPVERLENIHADLVSLLKNRTLPKTLAEKVLDDIQFISGLREALKDRQTFVSYLWSTLSFHNRKLYQQQQLQRDITKLVNNDIFTHAASLKVLSHR